MANQTACLALRERYLDCWSRVIHIHVCHGRKKELLDAAGFFSWVSILLNMYNGGEMCGCHGKMEISGRVKMTYLLPWRMKL